jgi:hypothetical protein
VSAFAVVLSAQDVEQGVLAHAQAVLGLQGTYITPMMTEVAGTPRLP